MMGERTVVLRRALLRVQFEAACAGGSPAAAGRPLRGPVGHPQAAAALLQREWPALERPRAHDPHADHRVVGMATRANTKGDAAANLQASRAGSYRGVRIGKPPIPPSRPVEEIRDAVRAAFAKHPELLTPN